MYHLLSHKKTPFLLACVAVLLPLMLGITACSDSPGKDRNSIEGLREESAASFTMVVQDGATIYHAASCGTCHTPEMLGMFARQLDLKAFASIVRDGVRADGSRVFDVMPSNFYKNMSDGDAYTLYAFAVSHMDSQEASKKTEKWTEASKAVALLPEAGSARASALLQDEAHRGEYLVTAVGRCAQCHAEPGSTILSGGTYQGWDAYNITSDPVGGIGAWSEADLASYLRHGTTATKGTAAGPMAAVIAKGTSLLPETDIHAMARYLLNTEGVNNSVSGKARTSFGTDETRVHDIRTQTATVGDSMPLDGKTLYNAYCASCHSWRGTGVEAGKPAGYPAMLHNSTTGADSAVNLTHVVLHGLKRDTDITVVMPSFSAMLTDDEASVLINYVTGQFGNPDATITPAEVNTLR